MTSELKEKQRLRLVYIGDIESKHTRRWMQAFRDLGHDVHAVAFYEPEEPPEGVQVHSLAGKPAPSLANEQRGSAMRLAFSRLPAAAQRLAQASRYARAGLRGTIESIKPDVVHAHYVVEHGFFAAAAGIRPLVVSAWGSDLLVETRSIPGRALAAWTLRRAALVTANDPSLAARAVSLGAHADRVKLIRLGVDDLFLTGAVGANEARSEDAPTIISTRALEPLYNLDVIIRAFTEVRRSVPAARLLVTHDGSMRPRIEGLVRDLGLEAAVEMRGTLDAEELREALGLAQVYVSVPSSDSMAVSTLEAMAMGCFPIVSDLASQRDLLSNGRNGLLVAPGDVGALARAMESALSDAARRAAAAHENRAIVAAQGGHRQNMLQMERLYFDLAGAGEQS